MGFKGQGQDMAKYGQKCSIKTITPSAIFFQLNEHIWVVFSISENLLKISKGVHNTTNIDKNAVLTP